MNKVGSLYILMLVVCALALWLIVRVGSRLKAPLDWSGTWVISAEQPIGGARDPATLADELGQTMRVEQSGQFFHVQFEKMPPLDLRLTKQSEPGTDRPASVRLEGRAWRMWARLDPESGVATILLDGPSRYGFTARRAIEPDAHAAAITAPRSSFTTHAAR